MQKSFRFIIFIFIFSLTSSIFAQNSPTQPKEDLPNPFQIVDKYVRQNNYITPIFELEAQKEKYLAAPQWREIYLEMLILLQGYVGNYKEAYRYENMLYEIFPYGKQLREANKNDVTDLKKSPIVGFEMHDAQASIEAAANKNQVIVINEEHRTPFHRALTLQLLSPLYEKGFRYFAVETIYETDTDLNTRKFPTHKTGYYTADPVYADAIRTALRLGYKIVPYESVDRDCKPTTENPQFCQDKREREQAQNIYDRILKNDPQAKIFVHVGRAHAFKGKVSDEFNFMAYYFKELSKIEPFTIDQLRFSERGDTALELPLYRHLTKNNFLLKPSVYRSPEGNFYAESKGYDVSIFHPRMRYENGRATFLRMNGMRKATEIDLKELKLKSANKMFAETEPILIQAFYAQESEDAVPVDQIILYPNQKISPLMLPKGKFRIRAMDKAGKILSQYEKK
jgi:hypothetical protein